VAFRCADDYTESLDMATALHPKLCWRPNTPRNRSRIRSVSRAKWVTAIEVTDDFPDTFWRKQAFNWFAGL
jgi:DMSO/TMAO reductase YedYZ molybdopterin-dependent catalytic subunit